MSLLTYNGITLQLLRTISFEMFNERDPSGTDVLWNSYRIKAIGIPTTDDTLTTPSATTIAAIKERLNTPRCAISYAMNGGTTIFSATGLDAAMGPEAASPAIVRQVTSDAIFVEVDYKVRLRDCATGNPDPVVSLRWDQTESFNELWYGRLVTSGRLVVRSDLRKSADSFRELCTPGVPTRYRRLSSEYRMSRSGCELDFTFVDEQQYLMPPVPVRKAGGRSTVVVSKGSLRHGQVDIHLESGPGGRRTDLMLLAIKLAFSKLQAEGLGKDNYTLLNGKFSESLWENSVDVSLSAALPPIPTGTATKAPDGNPSIVRSAGETPGFREKVDGIGPPIRDKIVGLLVAAFRDPCAAAALDAAGDMAEAPGDKKPKLKSRIVPDGNPFGGTNPNGTRGGNTGDTGGGGGSGGGSFSLYVGDLPPAGEATLTDTAPYDHYLIESEYIHDSGRRMLPGTGVGPDKQKAAVVTVHGGQMYLEVAWTARRTATPPVLPARESIDPNFTYLDGSIVPAQLAIGADGYSPVYEVSGRYLYGVTDPDVVVFAAPVPPFLAPVVGAAAPLAAAYFSDSILWQFRGQTGGGTPDDSIAKQLGGGIIGALIGLASGGGQSGGISGDSDGGGGNGLLGGPTLGN